MSEENVNKQTPEQPEVSEFQTESPAESQPDFDDPSFVDASSGEQTEVLDGQDEQAELADDQLDDLFLSPDEEHEEVIEMGEDGVLVDELNTLNEQVELAEKERDEFKERWMRASADLDNLRKRTRREKDEFRKYGHDKFALELLPVVDNLERALEHASKSADSSSIVDGVQMVYRQIVGVLEKHGIVGIDARGSKFDPEHHEAIQQVETSEHETGTVVEQYQKGYSLHDRLLRPAMVSVAKRSEGGNNSPNTEANSTSADDESADEPSTGE